MVEGKGTEIAICSPPAEAGISDGVAKMVISRTGAERT
jgi:hypothetical protein